MNESVVENIGPEATSASDGRDNSQISVSKILVIANPGVSQEALFSKAAHLAEYADAEVEIVGFINDQEPEALMTENDLQAQLDLAIAGHFASSDSVSTQVIETSKVADWVIGQCERQFVDLVIKVGRRTEHLLYQPTDWQLIRGLKCPLMLLSDKKWSSANVLLSTIDIESTQPVQTAMNQQVLLWTKYIQGEKTAQLHAMSCIELSRALIELDMVDPKQVEREKRVPVRDKMESLCDELDIGTVRCSVSAGDPSRKIPSLANELRADLVVMGSIGRKGAKGLLLGNTAEKVIHNLRTDVLIVKPG